MLGEHSARSIAGNQSFDNPAQAGEHGLWLKCLERLWPSGSPTHRSKGQPYSPRSFAVTDSSPMQITSAGDIRIDFSTILNFSALPKRDAPQA
jgi:hypothetical protein